MSKEDWKLFTKHEIGRVRSKLWSVDPRPSVVEAIAELMKKKEDYPDFLNHLPKIIKDNDGYITPIEFLEVARLMSGGSDEFRRVTPENFPIVLGQLKSALKEKIVRDQGEEYTGTLLCALDDFVNKDKSDYLSNLNLFLS